MNPRTLILLVFVTVVSTAGAVHAEPVRIGQVVQTLSRSQGPWDLKLAQDPVSSGVRGSTTATEPRSDAQGAQGSSDAKLDSLLAGFPIVSDPQQIGVEIVEEGEVEGTICDCGEILIAGEAFPKWPLLFLAAVPVVFINSCDDCDESTTPTPTPPTTPTPTPTPPGIPEPASLLLFGTGLVAIGAGLRRRYAKAKAMEQANSLREEE